ncbi:MAG: hypothetical protein ACE5GM_11015 [bacterium]
MIDRIERIGLPDDLRQKLFHHCRRKFENNFLPGETGERKAYGIIGGYIKDKAIKVGEIYQLKKNLRFDNRFDESMTGMMAEHAIPSKTPFEKRGWVADPEELLKIYEDSENKGMIICGSYHMHIVPWKHDSRRETPTEIDAALARDSNMFQFIISLVDPRRPVVRAFYEGDSDREVPIKG